VRRLRDRLVRRPRLLFVGINPSLRSAEVGHHFAGPGNPFWRLLHASGLVPAPMTYADDVRLPALGLALTNIVARPTRSADELTPAEYAAGARRLRRLVARIEPDVVAFVGVTVYARVFGGRGRPGGGPKPERIGAARVFVVPNPSGRNAAYPGFADKLRWYRRLARYAGRGGRPPAPPRAIAWQAPGTAAMIGARRPAPRRGRRGAAPSIRAAGGPVVARGSG
jgi:TDG/mug DNA glycosylase family protein